MCQKPDKPPACETTNMLVSALWYILYHNKPGSGACKVSYEAITKVKDHFETSMEGALSNEYWHKVAKGEIKT